MSACIPLCLIMFLITQFSYDRNMDQHRSSNLTHALLIQISWTSLIIDIVVPSKMAAGGHFVKTIKKKSCVSI